MFDPGGDLFVVVVIALKFGAVPVSLYALGRDLLRLILGQSSQFPATTA